MAIFSRNRAANVGTGNQSNAGESIQQRLARQAAEAEDERRRTVIAPADRINDPVKEPRGDNYRPGDQVKNPQEELAEQAAAAEAKKSARDAGIKKKRAEMEEKARLNNIEKTDGIDHDNDGFVGGDPMFGGKAVTDENRISGIQRGLLDGIPDGKAEREAAVGEMRRQRAEDIQSSRARSGLGGMGLTGAAGAMESQVRKTSARNETLTTAELDRRNRQEEMARQLAGVDLKRSEQVFGAETDLYEQEADKDINGDGFINGVAVGKSIGDGDPSNNGDDDDDGINDTERQKRLDRMREDKRKNRGIPRDTPPPGATLERTEPGFNFFRGKDGVLYKVPTNVIRTYD